MKKLKTLIALLICACPLFLLAGSGPGNSIFRLPSGVTASDMVPGKLIIKLKPEFRSQARLNAIGIDALNQMLISYGVSKMEKKFPNVEVPASERNAAGLKLADLSLIYELTYSSDQPIEKVVNSILKSGYVVYAEPKYLPKELYTTNDPNTGLQYFLGKIQANAAWDISKGDTNVVIGITDTGTDPNHPDLAPNIKYNYADPIDGVDNDADGYIDNFIGWDLGEVDNDPSVNASNHGSHVSGCADAATDNGIGVASPGFRCKFLPVKIADASGALTEAYAGITYAADHGCQIINCSWGGAGGGSFGQDVIDYATVNKNALVVAAAGNNGNEDPFFPASYNYVLSVASTQNNDGKSSFSNYGANIDVCAPGSNIYTAMSDDTYGYMSGTSMASPITSGAAAVVKAMNPTFTGLQVGEQLRVTCDNIYTVPSNGVYLDKLGKGRINMYRALTETGPSVRMSNINFTDNNDDAFVVGDTIRFTGDITNYLLATTNLDITLTSSSPWITIIDNNTNVGVLGTLATVNNNTDPFTFKINAGTPQNTVISLKLNFADGSYTDFQYLKVTVNVDYINITVNEISTTITSKGRLCYNGEGQTEGLGFQFNSNNLVYEAGLMIGQSASKVSDNVRGAPTTDNEFQSAQVVTKITPPVVSEFDLYGKFNDTPAASPIPVLVTHKAYAWSTPGDTRYVIVEYTIKNSGTTSYSNLYAGVFADWDIQDYNFNRAQENTALKMGYAFNTQAGGLYAGIKLLTPTPFNHYAVDNVAGQGGVNMTDGYDTGEKYTTLSTARAASGQSGTGNDVIDVVSTGPFTLASGDSVKVAFALLAGDSEADLNTSAGNAQIKYDQATGINENQNTASSFVIYPNPVRDVIEIYLNSNQSFSYAISDVSGRIMKQDNDIKTHGNNFKIPVNTLANGVYFITVRTSEGISTNRFIKN